MSAKDEQKYADYVSLCGLKKEEALGPIGINWLFHYSQLLEQADISEEVIEVKGQTLTEEDWCAALNKLDENEPVKDDREEHYKEYVKICGVTGHGVYDIDSPFWVNVYNQMTGNTLSDLTEAMSKGMSEIPKGAKIIHNFIPPATEEDMDKFRDILTHSNYELAMTPEEAEQDKSVDTGKELVEKEMLVGGLPTQDQVKREDASIHETIIDELKKEIGNAVTRLDFELIVRCIKAHMAKVKLTIKQGSIVSWMEAKMIRGIIDYHSRATGMVVWTDGVDSKVFLNKPENPKEIFRVIQNSELTIEKTLNIKS